MTSWNKRIVKELISLQFITMFIMTIEFYIIYGRFFESLGLTVFLRLQSVIIYYIVRVVYRKKRGADG